EGELRGGPVLEVFRQVDAVVGRAGLFAEGDDLVSAIGVQLDEALAEAVPDHAVANDHYRLLALANHGKFFRKSLGHWGATTRRRRPGGCEFHSRAGRAASHPLLPYRERHGAGCRESSRNVTSPELMVGLLHPRGEIVGWESEQASPKRNAFPLSAA